MNNNMPYLNDKELGYGVVNKMSLSQLKRAYKHIASIPNSNNDTLLIFEKEKTHGFMTGFKRNDHISVVLSISARVEPFPVTPTHLNKYFQVAFVRIAQGFENEGLTRLVYLTLGKLYDIVSDHEQYLGAEGLWKSLANHSEINIYVFDGNKKDYHRTKQNNIINYNGTNIEPTEIWGQSMQHKNILLVATTKKLH